MESGVNGDAWAIDDFVPRSINFTYDWTIKSVERPISMTCGKLEMKSPFFNIPDVSKELRLDLDFEEEDVGLKRKFSVVFLQVWDQIPFAATLTIFSGERKMVGRLGDPRQDKYVVNCRNVILPEDGSFYMEEDEEDLVLKLTLFGCLHKLNKRSCAEVKLLPEPLMECIFNNPKYSDIAFKCGETMFHCHKVILATMSPVFDSMFQIEMIEKERGEVVITDIEAVSMKKVLGFIYTGKIEEGGISDIDDLEILVYAAEKYELPGLVKLCAKEMKKRIDDENALKVLLVADRFGLKDIKEETMRWIVKNRERLMKKNNGFSQQIENCPLKLLVEMFKVTF